MGRLGPYYSNFFFFFSEVVLIMYLQRLQIRNYVTEHFMLWKIGKLALLNFQTRSLLYSESLNKMPLVDRIVLSTAVEYCYKGR